jgi:NAD(P)-dependent dehydrogenase (short-subunit alcohol dehydrogenase family)
MEEKEQKEQQPKFNKQKEPENDEGGSGLEEFISELPNFREDEISEKEIKKEESMNEYKDHSKEYKEKSEEIQEQTQEVPGYESEMDPQPIYIRKDYKGSDKLLNKVALITGGDSGIGRSVAVHFAREGASVAFVYLEEDEDAEETKKLVEAESAECIIFRGDIRDPEFCEEVIRKTVDKFGKINILVNHAGEQHPTTDPQELDFDLMEDTFQTNIFAMYYLTKPALRQMNEGDCIITTSSVTAYVGSPRFLDYSATNGAIVSFTRALAHNLADRKIRVNGVAPGPIWTPLIPSTFSGDDVEKFGKDTPLQRPGQPCEVAPSYVFLASEDGSYTTGQFMHPNGGKTMQS